MTPTTTPEETRWLLYGLAGIALVMVVFLGLFFVTVGLDEVANPRLRRAV